MHITAATVCQNWEKIMEIAMSSDFTFGDAALVGQGLGLFGQIAGSFYSAKTQKAQAKAQAEIAESNARLSEISARSALAAGTKNAARVSLQSGQLKSRQRAALAASGVELGHGSAAELLAGTDLLKEVDLNQIESNALSQAWGYRSQASEYQSQAAMARANAKSVSPVGNAFATLLTGAGSVAQSWYNLNKSGSLGTFASGSKTGGSVGGGDPIQALGSLNNWWK